jgi:hypothetical protein
MLEIPVVNPSETENEYKHAIESITECYLKHQKTPLNKFLIKPDTSDEPKWHWNQLPGLPTLEKFVIWDKDLKKFARNWGVEYSSYLTMLYGFQTQLAFEEFIMPKVTRWNRVLGRIKNNDKMTPKNLDVIKEMEAEGFVPAELAKEYAGTNTEEETV